MQKTEENESVRAERVDGLISQCDDDESRKSLQFAKVWYVSLHEESKLKFLLGNPSHFDLLRAWSSKNKHLGMEEFSQAEGHFRDMKCTDLMKASEALVRSEACIAAVAHPVAKQLLQDWYKLLGVAQGGDYEGGDDPYEFLVGSHKLLACLKLSVDVGCLEKALPVEELAVSRGREEHVQGHRGVVLEEDERRWRRGHSELASDHFIC